MEVRSVSNNTVASAASKNSNLDKNAFLKILTAQLSNQDPLNAKDNSEYVAQMAQFSALEQTQNLNSSIEKLLTSQRITEGTMFINKNVEFKLEDDSLVKEIVKGVRVDKNNVYLVTEGGKYSIDQVVNVEADVND